MKSLKSTVVAIDPTPYIVEASPKFERLALAAPSTGSNHIQIVDTKTRKLTGQVDFKSEFKAMCWSLDGKSIFVGANTIGELDTTTLKKTKSAFKGGKAPANALAVSGDGKLLYSANGSRTKSDDCFVRAFDVKSGELVWKAKPKSQLNGFASIAPHGDLVCSASANRVFAFDAKGALAAELELPADASVGGVASNGTQLAAIWHVKKKLALGLITLAGKTLALGKVVDIPLAADPDEDIRPRLASVSGDHAVATCRYVNAEGYGAHAVFRVKLATAKLVDSLALDDTGDVNALRLAHADGRLAWPTSTGVAFGQLAS